MIITFFILAAGILNLILGILIIFSAEKRNGILPLAFFSFATFSVACSDFFIYNLQWPIFDRLSFAFGSLIPIFLLSWIYCYAYENSKKWILVLIYFLGALFFLLAMTSNLIIYDIQISQTVGLQEKQGILFPFYFSIFLLAYVVVLISLILMLRTKDEMRKKQVGVILTGFSIYGASGIIFGLLLPTMGYDKFIDFDIIASFIFIGFTSYAVTKYKWMNIKIITVQLLSLAVVGISFFEIFFAETLSQKMYKIAYFLVLTVVSVFLIRNSKEEVERKDQLQMMADRLSRANDQLRKLDNAKTEFISIASHQLRTPATAIKGFTSLILEGTYGEIRSEVKGALEKVYASTEQLIQLIEELLNVTRIESERMAFMFEKESLEKLLKELHDNFLLISKTKKFYFDLELPDKHLPEIVMDYGKIRELVSNFIDNALKYTEKGGVTVKAEIRDEGVVIDENGFVIFGKKSEFGKVIRITVSDTGIGIPKEEIPYLFKKFSRGKDVSRLHVSGTGLGLYVGKAIAEAHHGQVWVESDGTGKGSRFIIELPIKNKLG